MTSETKQRHRQTCQGVVDLLCDFIEGDLPTDEERELETHMEDCPPCLAFLKTYRKTSELCKVLRPEDIPPELTEKLQRFLEEFRTRDS